MPKVSKGVRNQFGLEALVLEFIDFLSVRNQYGYHHIFFFFKWT